MMTLDKKYVIGLYTLDEVYLKKIYLSTGNIKATEKIPERIAHVAVTNKIP